MTYSEIIISIFLRFVGRYDLKKTWTSKQNAACEMADVLLKLLLYPALTWLILFNS